MDLVSTIGSSLYLTGQLNQNLTNQVDLASSSWFNEKLLADPNPDIDLKQRLQGYRFWFKPKKTMSSKMAKIQRDPDVTNKVKD